MQSQHLKLAFFTLFVVLNVNFCTGCSCSWMPLESLYCTSNFVIKAKVLTELEPPWQNQGVPEGVSTTTESWLSKYNKYLEYTYEIEIEDVYKSTPIYEDAVKVITINGIGGCLRRLHPGNTYFLMGYVTSPTLSISHCDVAYNLEYDWAEETAEGLISEPPVCGEPEYYTLDEYLKNNNLEKKNSVRSKLWRKIFSNK
ncbi:uncharacterized protein LOC132723583 [Ruditapes philippinarum]|uniref:uncharacterized protein LOC132723583 n=1 Tax=Ruditapes philippinarum TaxID=129788 RepID=UPI00295AC383|nr:uncharacterized protein LOC132723583 [Ruditapes philippinarum]